MSLTYWLRDYVFYPLVFSRALKRFGGRGRLFAAVMITGTLCGMWHGAGIQFVLFGLLMGACLVLDRMFTVYLWRQAHPTVRLVGGWLQTQVMIAMVIALFIAPIPVALELWTHMFTGGLSFHLLNGLEVTEAIGVYAGTILVQIGMARWKPREWIVNLDLSSVIRPAYVMSLSMLALYFAVVDAAFALAPQKFIYFQF